MNNRVSVATIAQPQFINLQESDFSPLVSKCEIKVFYIGQNRNKSCITKAVATEMSKTLRCCPIVGYYIESKEDFGDHGDQMIVDGEGVRFNKLTKPYGFVAPDAKVWFQFFEDTDEFGNTIVREYLVTEGYLWTGQFNECKRALDNSNPHSMELDEKSMQGHWSTDNNSGLEFFIIDRAIFSELCILGEDVEPCFEGSMITTPKASSYSYDDDFVTDLMAKITELNFALNQDKGGLSMEDSINTVEEAIVEAEMTPVEPAAEVVENFSNEQDNLVEIETAENENITEEFAKKEDEEEPAEKESVPESKDETKDEEEDPEKKKDKSKSNDDYACGNKDDEKKKAAAKCELLEAEVSNLNQELETLRNEYALLKAENQELAKFKQSVEDKEKDALIATFTQLSDADKKDIIDNKSNYSLREIKAELSMMCYDKGLSFADNKSNKDKEIPSTYNLNAVSIVEDNAPEWIKAVRANRTNY